MSRVVLRSIALGSCLVIVAVGCSRDSVIRGTVKGRVTIDGAPLTGAAIFVESEETKTAIQTNLDANGEFEFKTHNTKGLPVGNYKVAISPGGVMDPNDSPILAGKNKAPVKAIPFPAKYTATATSGLTAEVKEGENPPFDFPLVR